MGTMRRTLNLWRWFLVGPMPVTAVVAALPFLPERPWLAGLAAVAWCAVVLGGERLIARAVRRRAAAQAAAYERSRTNADLAQIMGFVFGEKRA